MKIVLPTIHSRRSNQSVPLAAGCLVAALPEELSREAALLDLFPDQGEDDLLAAILATEPDLIAFPLYVWNRTLCLSLCRKLRQALPATLLVAGGPEATSDPTGVLEEGQLHGVIRGEGEIPFAALAGRLSEEQDPAGLPGVLWMGEEGPVDGGHAEPVQELGELPSPWLSGHLTPTADGGVLWETARGCPFHCAYCFDARGGHGVRHHCLDRLRAELELFARCGASQVWVLDSTFNFPPKKAKELLRLFLEVAPHLHYHLEAKADFLDPELIALLGRLDCSVQLGLQSIHPEVLHHIGRGIDLEDFRAKAERLSAEGVTFGLDLIYGLPGDSHSGFRSSLDTALQLAPNHLGIFRLALLPGTPLHRHRHDHGIIAQDGPPYEVQETASCCAEEMQQSALLAAATEIFYNTGRAVGFFPFLRATVEQGEVELIEEFARWAMEEQGVDRQRLLAISEWTAGQALALQEAFVRHLLPGPKDTQTVDLALDLIRYHYHYGETLIGKEVLPTEPERFAHLPLFDTPWRRNPHLRLVDFNFEIYDLMQVGPMDLRHLCSLFEPTGSTGLFLSRGGEVACESLEEGFTRLLRDSDGSLTPAAILGDEVSTEEAGEWVEFAVAEGLLLPPE